MTRKMAYISGSAMDDYRTCPRKWLLGRVFKVPQPPRKASEIGDAGHAVIDRYFKGRPLYPEGWETCLDRYTGMPVGNPLNTSEQSMLKSLIDCAIRPGKDGRVILNKEPDGRSEFEFKEKMPSLGVVFTGYIDYLTAAAVVDHKFIGSGSAKYYSPERLRKSIPMLLYAWVARRRTGSGPLWLRYNLFVKGADPVVKTVEVEVTPREIEEGYEMTLMPTAREMADIRTVYACAEEFESMPCDTDACGKYGGCPYALICSGTMGLKDYMEIMSKGESDGQDKARELLNKDNDKEGAEKMADLSFLDRVKAAKAGEAVPAAAPAAKPAQVEKQEAPWYMGPCSCDGNQVRGLNSKLAVCQVCKFKSAKKGGPKPDDYIIDVTEDGTVTITPRGGERAVASKPPEVRVPREVVVPADEELEPEEAEPALTAEDLLPAQAETPPPEDSASLTPPATPTPPPVVKPTASAESAAEAAAASIVETDGFDVEYEQRRGGYTLAYVPLRSKGRQSKQLGRGDCIITIQELAELVATGIEKALRKTGTPCEGFFAMPRFTRRDLIYRNAESIRKLVGNSTVDASAVQTGSDHADICMILEGEASEIYGSM